MWNVNRFQREMPGLSAAPSQKCPVCSGRCLYLPTLITLIKLRVFDTFWSFTTHMWTDAHTLTLVLTNCTNEESKMPLYQHHWIKIYYDKVRYVQSSVKKKKISVSASASPSLSLFHFLHYGLLRFKKIFTCCLESKVVYNIKIRYA